MKTMRLAAVLACTTVPVLAALPVGRGELSFGATAMATYDTNINGTHDGTEDYYGTLTPRARYERKAGQIEVDASLALAILRFADQTRFNADNLAADLTFRLREDPTQKLSGAVTAGYHETSEVNPDLNERIRAKTTTFSGLGTLVTGPRTRFGLDASSTDVTRSTASDQKLMHGELRFDYEGFLDDTSLRLAYDRDSTSTSGGNFRGVDLDQTANQLMLSLARPLYRDVLGRFGVGYRVLDRSAAETGTGQTRLSGTVVMASIEGPFLPPRYFPKIKSRLAFSYENAAAPGVNDTGTKNLAGNLSLVWQARETTVISLLAERSQRLTADDLTVVSTTARLRLEQNLRYNLTGSLSAGYDWETFRGVGRSDRRKSGEAGLSYHFARTWDASAVGRVESTSSTQVRSAFNRQLVSLTLGHQF